MHSARIATASRMRRDRVGAADELREPRGGFYPFEMNPSAARAEPGRLLRAHDSPPRANRIVAVYNDLELEFGSNRKRSRGIEKRAREIVKAGESSGTTFEQAYVQALDENPDLYSNSLGAAAAAE